jgi:hypothetical protein
VIELSASRGRVALRLTAERLGDDLAVTLSGGDRPHVGAVAVSQPRPADGGATTSVHAIVGHREDELARRIAARLAGAIRAVVCVACGIHVDRIRPREIEAVFRMSDDLAEQLLARLAVAPVGRPRRLAQRASSSHHRRSQAPKRRKPRRSTV